MIKFLKIFFSVFLLLLIVGLLSGYSDHKDIQKAITIKNTTVRMYDGNAFLAFSCGGETRHLFNTETNALSSNPNQLAELSILPIVFSFQKHKDVILAAIGGTSGGLTLSKISKLKSGRNIAAIVLGFGSGYLVGYWITTLFEID